MSTVACDFETYYKKKDYSVADLGNWRYTHDERFDPYLISVCDEDGDHWAGEPKDFNWESLRGADLLAHNMSFDGAVLDRMIEMGQAPAWLLENKRQCTANMTSFLASTRSLASSVKLLEGRNLSKQAREDMNGKQWREITPAQRATMIQYAAGDAIESQGLYKKYGHRWPQFERDLSSLTMLQCKRGVAINTELLEEYRQILMVVIFNLEQSLPWVARGKKVTSPIAIAEECRAHGIPAPPVKSHFDDGEELYEAWENEYGPRFPWCYAAGKWRSLNKLLSALDTMKERLRPDGTIDFSLLYFGAHTGRWSGGGSGLNFQNFKKVPLFLKNKTLANPPSGLNFKQFKEWVENCTDYALDIRRLLIPRAGKKFILADLSQIEPRVLAWLCGNTEMLRLMAGGMSPYEAFARTSMGWKGGDLKKESPEQYQLSKIQVLGLGYGCADEKFITIAAGYDVYLKAEESKKIVLDFRMSNPLITGMWNMLGEQFIKSVGTDFVMELPSGRSMTYRNVRREIRSKKDREGKMAKRFVYTCDVGEKRVETYGGKLTENLVQAVARDVFGGHCLRLEKNIGEVIFTVHDEAITEVDLSISPKDVEAQMAINPSWCLDLPTAAEAIEAACYKK